MIEALGVLGFLWIAAAVIYVTFCLFVAQTASNKGREFWQFALYSNRENPKE